MNDSLKINIIAQFHSDQELCVPISNLSMLFSWPILKHLHQNHFLSFSLSMLIKGFSYLC